MPVHRVPMTELETVLHEIEATEKVVATALAGDGAVLVFTDPRDNAATRVGPGEKETR